MPSWWDWGPGVPLRILCPYCSNKYCSGKYHVYIHQLFFCQPARKLEVLCAVNTIHIRPSCPSHNLHLSGFATVDQNEMDGNHLIVTCTLHDQGNVMKSHALIDCGMTCYVFIDENYVCYWYLLLHLLNLPRNLTIIAAKPITSTAITLIICIYLTNR
jgi:hypothetical protein